MKRNLILTLVLAACSTTALKAQSYEERIREYIKTYCRMAVVEQQRSGIPAAITLAQGIHETSAGASELATEANNHFGIKCKKSWTGETFAHTDDAPNECFRKYKNAEISYKDHSDYLSTSPRYAELFKLSPTDYAAWAIGLRKCGYATNPKYANMLIKLIEDYKLQEYTYVAMANPGAYTNDIAKVEKEIIPEKDAPETASAADVNAGVPEATVIPATYGMPMPAPKPASKIKVDEDYHEPVAEQVVVEEQKQAEAEKPVTYPPFGEQVRVNGLKAVYARKGDMPLEYALKFDVRYERLLEFNDISDRPLSENMYLYLERKHVRGQRPTHVVKEGENMLAVSQYEGVQLKSIRMLNKLALGEEPVPGTVLQLQEETATKPELVAGTEVQPANIAVPEPYIVKKETPQDEIKPIKDTPLPPVGEEVVAQISSVPETEIVAATNAVPEAVNIANEQPVEAAIEEEKKLASLPPQSLPEQSKVEEKPVDEFDALKARFDKVVYAKRDASAAEPVPAEEVKQAPVAEPVPAKEEIVAKEESKEELLTVKGKKYYTVKKGDTAFGIAKRNNISMRDLLDMNDLDFRELKVGQKLRIQ